MIEVGPSALRTPAATIWLSSVLHMAALPAFLFSVQVLQFPQLKSEIDFSATQPDHVGFDVAGQLPALSSQGITYDPKKFIHLRPSMAAASVKRVIFRGPQTIISLSDKPDNLIQTVRRLESVKVPKLKVPFPAPNLLRIAASAPILESRSALDVGQTRTSAKPSVAPPMLAEPRKNTSRIPKAEQGSGSMEPDASSVVVLNAIPVKAQIREPVGELSGAFIVTPGREAQAESEGDNFIAGRNPADGETKILANASISNARREEPGKKTAHSIVVGVRTKVEQDIASDHTSHSERAPSVTATIAGPDPFPGIDGNPPSAAKASSPRGIHRLRGVYGMIVSSSPGGGGLKDYGYFTRETVYTVFLNVSDENHARPNWTLQYAAILPAGTVQSEQLLLIPPFPDDIRYPSFRNTDTQDFGRMAVLGGVITEAGAVDSLVVVQSLDSSIAEVLVECLKRWTFHPAEWNGRAVAVKFLIGIPLSDHMMGSE